MVNVTNPSLNKTDGCSSGSSIVDTQSTPLYLQFGGCLSRSTLPRNRPWMPSIHEKELSKLHPVWHVVGLGRDFFWKTNTKDNEDVEDDKVNKKLELEGAVQALVETIASHPQQIVGLFADLDYCTPEIHRNKPEREWCEAQLERLRATLFAAVHPSNTRVMTVQIRLLPCDNSDSNKTSEAYSHVVLDLATILSAYLPHNKDLKVPLSCWAGSPLHMNELVQKFPNQVYIGMDATVTFSKANEMHECAFELHPNRLLLETGRPGTIPSILTRTMGRDAYGHPAWSIPWIAESMASHSSPMHGNDGEPLNATSIARAASANTTLLYPGVLAVK